MKYQQALKLRDAGLSVIVLGDDKSRPLGKWKQFQSEIITVEELQRRCNYKTAKNIAIIGGRVSGQLYQMDFDDHHQLGCMFDEWKRLVSEADANILLAQLVIHKTPNNGYHVRWRVDTDEKLPTEDLAQRWIIDKATGEIVLNERGKPKIDTFIESRAEDNYALCPPSPGYKCVSGSLLDIPTISAEFHELLVSIARTFHSAVETPSEKKPQQSQQKGRMHDGLSPGDDFNKRGDYRKLLEKHQWTLALASGKVEYWKRPGTEHAWSATWNAVPDHPERFYCFSTNADFDDRKLYHKFAMYAVLECDGDFTLAAKRLAAEGYGEQPKPEEKQRTTKRQSVIKTGEDRYIEIKALVEQHFRKGTKPDKIFGIAKEVNDKQCQPPIPDDEIIALINSLKPRLPTQTGAELLAKDIPPPKWAVEDFIPEGLTIFAGKPKIGKSWLMLGISLAVALGGKALGEIDVEEGDVLYCALEDNERRLQTRLEILLPDGAKPERFHYIALGDLPKMDRGGLDLIGTFLDDMPSTRLIVIDTLQKFKAHGNSKRNMYEEDYDIFGVLQHFAMSRGLALVLIHHMRKAEADYELDEISGSTGATGASDSILILKRNVDGLTLYRQGRDVIEETFAMRFDSSDCTFTIQGEAKEVHMSEARQAIIQLIEGAPNGLTAKSISGALNKNHGTIKSMLSKMVSDELLTNINTHYVIKL